MNTKYIREIINPENFQEKRKGVNRFKAHTHVQLLGTQQRED